MPELETAGVSLWIVYPARRALPRRVRVFVDFLLAPAPRGSPRAGGRRRGAASAERLPSIDAPMRCRVRQQGVEQRCIRLPEPRHRADQRQSRHQVARGIENRHGLPHPGTVQARPATDGSPPCGSRRVGCGIPPRSYRGRRPRLRRGSRRTGGPAARVAGWPRSPSPRRPNSGRGRPRPSAARASRGRCWCDGCRSGGGRTWPTARHRGRWRRPAPASPAGLPAAPGRSAGSGNPAR